jgi:hypothetical protein
VGRLAGRVISFGIAFAVVLAALLYIVGKLSD